MPLLTSIPLEIREMIIEWIIFSCDIPPSRPSIWGREETTEDYYGMLLYEKVDVSEPAAHHCF